MRRLSDNSARIRTSFIGGILRLSGKTQGIGTSFIHMSVYTQYIYICTYIGMYVYIYIYTHILQVCLYSCTCKRCLDASSGVCTWRKGERSSSTDRTQVCISYEEIDDTQCRIAWPSRALVQHGWYVSPGVGRLCGECRPSSHRQ